jgi:3-isopropylmalate/(R)-2-methylmalate dehydratase small subunit
MKDFEWRLSGRCYKLDHDVPHAGTVIPVWLISGRYTDPKDLVQHLFEAIDPGFHERARPGDIIVTGRNFGMGPKMNGYIAMQALGLGLVCESMPFLAYRAAIGCGLRVLTDCAGVTQLAETGDDVTVDFATGAFHNRTRNLQRQFSPLPGELREIVARGGNAGWLRHWWENRGHAPAEGASPHPRNVCGD